MLYRILEIIVPVFGIVLLSFAYGRWRPTDMSSANRLNLVIFIPALIFYALTEKVGQDVILGTAALGTVVIVLGSGLLAWGLARLLGWQARTLVSSSMFNNCGNMGIPLAVFAFGEQSLALAVVLLVTTTVIQFSLGLVIFSGKLEWKALLTNPMLLATLAGVVAMQLDWHAPDMLLPGIKMLADVAIPLMLVALGMRLAQGGISEWKAGFIGGLVTPLTGLAIALPWVWFTQPDTQLSHNLLLYAVLPPAVMNFMLADLYQQEPGRMASIVAVGNAMAVVTVPALLFCLFA